MISERDTTAGENASVAVEKLLRHEVKQIPQESTIRCISSSKLRPALYIDQLCDLNNSYNPYKQCFKTWIDT